MANALQAILSEKQAKHIEVSTIARLDYMSSEKKRVRPDQIQAVLQKQAYEKGQKPMEMDLDFPPEGRQAVEHFGQFCMTYFRDRGISFYEMLMQGKWGSHAELSERLKALNEQQQQAVEETVVITLDTVLHDVLFQLGIERDMHRDDEEGEPLLPTPHVQVLVDGYDIARYSDGLQGELFTWIERLSQYQDLPHGGR